MSTKNIPKRSARLAAKQNVEIIQPEQQKDVDETVYVGEDVYQEADNASIYDGQSPLQKDTANIQTNVPVTAQSVTSRKTSSSKISCANSIRRRQAEAELESERKLFELQQQLQYEMLRKKEELIMKELQVKKMQICEEVCTERSERSSRHSDRIAVNLSNDESTQSNLRTLNWINSMPNGNTNNRQTMTYNKQIPDGILNQETSAQNKLQTDSDKFDKFMTRQSIKLDLPIFSGNPVEWPSFICQYNDTTNICQLSNIENISRLQKSLKGKARETVQALLTLPNQVDQIISTLERRFGRPEYIIDEMISQVRRVPAFKEENLDSIIDFANIIQNLTVTIQSLQCQEHLMNPNLLKELVNKLSCSLKLRWGERCRILIKPNLSDFCKWIQEIADAASMVCKPKFVPNDVKPTIKKGYRELTLSTTENKVSNFICIFCKKTNHLIEKCKLFINKNVDERWKYITENKICFSCLRKGHQIKQCIRRKICGEGDCQKPHHKLLHNVSNSTTNYDTNVTTSETSCHTSLVKNNNVLLRIAPVILKGPSKNLKRTPYSTKHQQ